MSEQNNWEHCEVDDAHEAPTWKCIHCAEVFCEVCMKKHKRKDKNRFHCIIAKSDREREREIRDLYFCNIHTNAELNMFCNKDNEAICRFCLSEKHKGHDVKPIEDVANPFRTDVGNLLTDLDKKIIPRYEKVAKTMKNNRDALEKGSKSQTARKVADEMIAKIEKHVKVIESEEARSNQVRATAIKAKESKVEIEVERLIGAVADVRKALEYNGHNDLIKNAKRWKDMMKYDEKDLAVPAVGGKEKRVDEIRRELLKAAQRPF